MTRRHKILLLTGLYVAQGLPFGFFTQALPVLLRDAGFAVISDEAVSFHWRAPSRQELAAFCSLLFDLRGEGPVLLLEAAEVTLGIDELPGGVGLRWSLRTFVCTPV